MSVLFFKLKKSFETLFYLFLQKGQTHTNVIKPCQNTHTHTYLLHEKVENWPLMSPFYPPKPWKLVNLAKRKCIHSSFKHRVNFVWPPIWMENWISPHFKPLCLFWKCEPITFEPRMSPHLCIHHNAMNASIHKCNLTSHKYRVNLGQPKVNLSQRSFWVPRTSS